MTFEASDVDSLMKEALDKVRGHIRTADRVVFLMQEGRQFAIKAAHGGRPGREMFTLSLRDPNPRSLPEVGRSWPNRKSGLMLEYCGG